MIQPDGANFNTGQTPGVPLLGYDASLGKLVALGVSAGTRTLLTSGGGGGGGGTSSTDEAAFTAGVSSGTPGMGVVNPVDTPSDGKLAIPALDSSRRAKITVPNGADVALGTTTDAAITTDINGTAIGFLRGLAKVNNSIWSPLNNWISVSIQNATLAVTQSGAWTVALSAGSAIVGKFGIDQTTPGTTNKVSIGTDGTVAIGTALPAGTAVIGKTSIDQTTPGTTNLVAAGGVGAAGAAVSGNPMRNGGLGRTTLPTSVSSAQLADLLLDRYGRTYVVAPVMTTKSSAGTAITTNTNTSIVAAPSSGNHLRIHRLWAQNSSATGTWCYWGNGSGDKTVGPPFYLAQNQPFGMAVDGVWELSSATALFMNTATTGANIEWFVAYETLTD